MLLQKTVEYLMYLMIFIFLFKFSAASTINLTENSNAKNFKRAIDDCGNQFSWMCLKIEFVKLIERLAEQEELNLMAGISVVKDANATEAKTADIMADVARSYHSSDPNSRLNGYLVAKLSNFLQTRHLRLNLIDAQTVSEARSAVETGRKGKFGKKGGMEALIAAGLMMKGTLMAMGMGVIALMAGKALMTALMALTLSGVLGLKGLASGGGKSTTYEIVAKPIYSSSHTHSVSHDEGHGHGGGHFSSGHSGSGYGGYSRSLTLDLPKHLKGDNVVS